MHLHSITLDGFKIYENSTVVLLDNKYTSITGLNGSGKSNIIDGILFVLGVESLKLLRVKNLRELINTNKNHASVELMFKDCQSFALNTNNANKHNFSTLIIRRTIDSTLKSKYVLNNSVITQNNLRALLSTFNLFTGNNPSFIVQQGKITNLLNTSNYESILEEAAGIKEYKENKIKSMKILEKKELKLKESKNALERQLNPFFNNLKQQKLIYDSQKILENKKLVYLNSKNEIKIYLHKIDLFEKVKEFSETESKISKENNLETIKLKKKRGDILDEITDYNIEDNINSLKEMKNKVKESSEKIKRLNIIEEEIKENELMVKLLQENMDNNTNNNMNNNINGDLNKEVKDLESKIDFCGKCNTNFKLKSFNLNTNIENNTEILKCKCLKYLDLNNTNLYSNQNINLNVWKKFVKILNSELQKIKYPILKGVYGTLIENIEIKESKYIKAVNSVMGSKNNWIITETDSIARYLLKTSEFTCIPLNKIRTNTVNLSDSNPNRKPLISTLNFSPKIKKAVEFVFGNFFIYENGKEANKCETMSVDLEGTIYNPRGSITGGFVRINNKECDVSEVRKGYEILTSLVDINQENLNLKNLDLDEEFEFNSLKEFNENIIKSKRLNINENISNVINSSKIAEFITLFESLEIVTKRFSNLTKYLKLKTTLDNLNNSNLTEKNLENSRKLLLKLSKEKEILKLNNVDKINENYKKLSKKVELDSIKINVLKAELKELEVKINEIESSSKERIQEMFYLKNKVSELNKEIEEKVKILSNFGDDCFKQLSQNLRDLLSEYANLNIDSDSLDSNNDLELNYSSNITKRKKSFCEQEIKNYNSLKNSNLIKSILLKTTPTLKTPLTLMQNIIDKQLSTPKVFVNKDSLLILDRNTDILNNLIEKLEKLETDKQKIKSSIFNLEKQENIEIKKTKDFLNKKITEVLQTFIKNCEVKISDDFKLIVKIENELKSLNSLSGGQKSLISLSIIFAVLMYRPAPIYILDEVDSALDMSHTQNITKLFKKMCSQFLTISLKSESGNKRLKVLRKDGKSYVVEI